MNTPFHPFRPALQPLGHPLLPFVARSESVAARVVPLSARQRLDAELGLFLLAQLRPAARPDALPALLSDDANVLCSSESQSLTPRQQRALDRGRALLGPYRQPVAWVNLLHRYATHADHWQAYVLSADLSQYRQQTVGFFRNRVMLFKQVLGQ
jgi:pPIWI RE three-gene island domain Z